MVKKLGLLGLAMSALMFVGCGDKTDAYSLLAGKTFFIAACNNDDYSRTLFSNNSMIEKSFSDNNLIQEEEISIVYNDSGFITEDDISCRIDEHTTRYVGIVCSKDGGSKEATLWKTLQDARGNCSSEY